MILELQNGVSVCDQINEGKFCGLCIKNTFIDWRPYDKDEILATMRKSYSAPNLYVTRMEQASANLCEAPNETAIGTSLGDDCIMVSHGTHYVSIKSQSLYEGVVSKGSLLHGLGDCKPCSYFAFKEDGCRKGADCEFCHLCTQDEVRDKKKFMKSQVSRKKGHGLRVRPSAGNYIAEDLA
mmetsp:Transcript_98839/g.176060  ORF Transcript_98839/g.176060 Transcript_98839/m.176060 type:complete len:181 (+) Transcript_98839:60-602(+)|eukprot:CAMPEP_0197627224 /NCGR_PEP_ID=MMETSP1338-20131121/5897_1 /TAXON_ID=43686 ORGANISM="Pelagodinium beii, Strain RCC1491" /NCGR_SAMPLE_ID=MMETSP1338 /ASSEMBLY_ACC=CAM_ASM_000754 /LENGTH=180 /DNA_ID=CAMNT_0043197885 /DNA_START=60 /DNA_END=602 /DNA_ORIENTATION=+